MEAQSNRPTAEDVMNNAANVFVPQTYLGSRRISLAYTPGMIRYSVAQMKNYQGAMTPHRQVQMCARTHNKDSRNHLAVTSQRRFISFVELPYVGIK